LSFIVGVGSSESGSVWNAFDNVSYDGAAHGATSPAIIALGRSDCVVERDDRHLAGAVTVGFADCVCDASIR
jgi:hypothetical protein